MRKKFVVLQLSALLYSLSFPAAGGGSLADPNNLDKLKQGGGYCGAILAFGIGAALQGKSTGACHPP